ncbi:MAG: sulfur carrier protein ThiS [Nitrospinota bacterium]|jgi:sulfur carrier protein|nr:thiamine biosynthesis protein ThiS [Nitrospinota bacterium]MDP6279847.1 sulfur carrier protein ThiS [Nitrospinota bacterium]MDP6365106.1 sulfur carrier protein ThiS [Nitrospinota bacterium]MDP7167008.1 sulfur carrier protein ThiS [Nitrospinota bacterium]MDP7369119.1 sulfur carrier protein ThiS [Nitrospinota bacterium]|tara:strand:+ start:378 stop:578 length:201 start_codon:yes stop_codon:yes gene_type:complete
MKIQVNGEAREVESGATVADLLDSLGLEVNGLAVAVNMDIVRRGDYAAVKFSEGDEIEIVRAVGGG